MTTSGAVNIFGSAGNTDIESSDIHVVTTCRSGYNLALATSTSDNNLYLDGIKTDNTESAHISPSDGTTALINAPNTWGYLLSTITPTSNSVFLPVSPDSANPSIIKTDDETASDQDIDDNFAIYYASHIGVNLASGTYKMIPEDNSISPVVNGGLSYYLTA
ncbi:hypothetical protein IIW29_01550, partial [Candidatus Saccharibacteria bacterium]|nr:hypothetical protein [Candidatus Saccharibacteria bacterium]